VIGSRRMKAIKRILLGSMSEKVLVHASCSVLIVR
jgi:nucleotide-binding universal stress UspA family protein